MRAVTFSGESGAEDSLLEVSDMTNGFFGITSRLVPGTGCSGIWVAEKSDSDICGTLMGCSGAMTGREWDGGMGWGRIDFPAISSPPFVGED